MSHEGIKAAVSKVLNATWQRCRVHFMRNVLAHAGRQGRRVVSAFIATAFAQDDDDKTPIEGVYAPGQKAIIFDDLVTGGGSIIETAERLREAGLLVKDAFVLVDRQQGARERLKKDGINLRSALTLEVILNYLKARGFIEHEWYRRSMDYLDAGRR